jgi:leucyl/phenylalanyl-tRNA--protein transferase
MRVLIPRARFPDPRATGPEGIVAFGDDLRPETLIEAYRKGIFPWPISGLPLPWFCPEERAILEFQRLHIPRRLVQESRRSKFELTIDSNFGGVIRGCASAERPDQEGTWITPAIIAAYTRLHNMGIAHSVEAWENGRLIGGIYGVDAGGAFAAESMFYRRPNASKLALLYLIDRLASRGLEWLDIQIITPHMERFGATTITRKKFLNLLGKTQKLGLTLFP